VSEEVQPHNSSDGEGTEPGSLTGQPNPQTVELLLKKGLGTSPPLPPGPLLPVGVLSQGEPHEGGRYEVLVGREREQGVSWSVTSGTGVRQLR